jgi:hypothetical protein
LKPLVYKGVLDLNRCHNTGLEYGDCDCLDCRPWVWTYKGLLDECKTIKDLVKRFEEAWAYFKALDDGRFVVRGSIQDGFIQLVPPKRPGFYWMRCENCGSLFEAQKGSTLYSCPMCAHDIGTTSMSY